MLLLLLRLLVTLATLTGIAAMFCKPDSRARHAVFGFWILLLGSGAMTGLALWTEVNAANQTNQDRLVAEMKMLREASPITGLDAARHLTEHPIIGQLGLPLGTAVEVRAVFHDGDELHTKAHDGEVMLQVIEVDDKPSLSRPIMSFSVKPWVEANVANSSFGLYQRKHGREIGSPTENQVAEPKREYIGQSVRLVVYETGGYVGAPDVLPPDVMSWTDTGFYFRTTLVVLGERLDR